MGEHIPKEEVFTVRGRSRKKMAYFLLLGMFPPLLMLAGHVLGQYPLEYAFFGMMMFSPLTIIMSIALVRGLTPKTVMIDMDSIVFQRGSTKKWSVQLKDIERIRTFHKGVRSPIDNLMLDAGGNKYFINTDDLDVDSIKRIYWRLRTNIKKRRLLVKWENEMNW
ncbi:MAG: hypothetical protein ACMUIE_08185 [Thermoplasmatota archaeon]